MRIFGALYLIRLVVAPMFELVHGVAARDLSLADVESAYGVDAFPKMYL